MKFTKEEAYKELVARMTAKGEKLNLSERSINEQLETLITLVANEETELQDFVDKTLSLFKTADANVRNDVSVGINKYKEDNPIPKPQEPIVKTATDDVDNELLKRLEAMEQELANSKREKQQANIRKDILTALKNKGVKDENWVNTLLSEVNITDDFDVDSKVESYLKLYNISKGSFDSGATPDTANYSSEYQKEMFSKAREFREKKLKEQGIIKN